MIIVTAVKSEPVTSSVTVGVTTTEKATIAAAAQKAGLSVSAWSRRQLVTAAKR